MQFSLILDRKSKLKIVFNSPDFLDLKVNKHKTKLVSSPDGSGILFCFCKTLTKKHQKSRKTKKI